MKWRDDGDGCWALMYNNTVIAAYGPDASKDGYFRGFAFAVDGVGSHESIWAEEKDIKRDIEDWFDADGKMLSSTERKKKYDAR